MKVLYLNLHKEYFDAILAGEKKEEYREIKTFWTRQFLDAKTQQYRVYDHIRFRNGYGKAAPEMAVEFKNICIGMGRYPGVGQDKKCYVIKLGRIISAPKA